MNREKLSGLIEDQLAYAQAEIEYMQWYRNEVKRGRMVANHRELRLASERAEILRENIQFLEKLNACLD